MKQELVDRKMRMRIQRRAKSGNITNWSLGDSANLQSLTKSTKKCKKCKKTK